MKGDVRLEDLTKAGLKRYKQESIVEEVNTAVGSIIAGFEEHSGKHLRDKDVHIARFELDVYEEGSSEKSHFVYSRSRGFGLTSPFGSGFQLPWPFPPHKHCTWTHCIDLEIPIPGSDTVIVVPICIDVEYPCW
ncbi:hypothetical protein C474_16974 [Halogeometricum pallidum JCM 14848]|uniref:Uncharacterized protein n=1 Tax=Halogeometricum pallidum JCM 14848 TaxID=1227487 RepID=M0CUZ4_HALPD|nr:hypothetical protein [Halogeometricum pallidum]ELZ27061.1 hypothetical protein C474_16974 [Halogeometricum pallidum JCM 14848]